MSKIFFISVCFKGLILLFIVSVYSLPFTVYCSQRSISGFDSTASVGKRMVYLLGVNV